MVNNIGVKGLNL